MGTDYSKTISFDVINISIVLTGNRFYSKTTVFNDQSLIQMGGRYNAKTRRVDRPFIGVIAGVNYNGLRPLDLAAKKDYRTKVTSPSVKHLPGQFSYDDEMFSNSIMKIVGKLTLLGHQPVKRRFATM